MNTNPPHPGDLILNQILPSLGISVSQLADNLEMSRVSISRVLNGRADISPDLAVRLEKGGIGEAFFWMSIQIQYDIFRAKEKPENHINQFVSLPKEI